ncbi:MAG: PPOX class F420-dependent oxidoreductase [Solirubrobacteraceae bacterium]
MVDVRSDGGANVETGDEDGGGHARGARASARPVVGRRIPGSLFFARLAAGRGPRGAHAIVDASRTGSVVEVRAHKRALLVTYKRDDTAVPTPVWAAADADGRLYVRSERAAGKVKRLRRDQRLLVAPCTMRGRPLGAPFEARARVLPAEEESRAERTLAARYGLGRALFEGGVDLMRVDMCYLEIVAGHWDRS